MEKLMNVQHDLFNPPHMELKKAIYKSKQSIEYTIEAINKATFSTIAKKELPFKIKEHNSLIEKLNKLTK